MPAPCAATAPLQRAVWYAPNSGKSALGQQPARDFSGRPDGDTRFDDCNSYALDDGPFLARFAESCKANSGFHQQPTTLLQLYRASRPS